MTLLACELWAGVFFPLVELVLLSEAEASAGFRLAAADLVEDFAVAFVLPSAA